MNNNLKIIFMSIILGLGLTINSISANPIFPMRENLSKNEARILIGKYNRYIKIYKNLLKRCKAQTIDGVNYGIIDESATKKTLKIIKKARREVLRNLILLTTIERHRDPVFLERQEALAEEEELNETLSDLTYNSYSTPGDYHQPILELDEISSHLNEDLMPINYDDPGIVLIPAFIEIHPITGLPIIGITR